MESLTRVSPSFIIILRSRGKIAMTMTMLNCTKNYPVELVVVLK